MLFQIHKIIIQSDKGCAEQYSTNNIRKPVYARNKSADYHKYDKSDDCKADNIVKCFVFDSVFKLHKSSRHNTQYEQSSGRRIRRFKIAVNKYRTSVYHNVFKKYVKSHNQ